MYPNSILEIFAWMMDHRPQRKWDASAYLPNQDGKQFSHKSGVLVWFDHVQLVVPVGLSYHVLFDLCLVLGPVTVFLLGQITSDK